MSCYLNQLSELFLEIGLNVTDANRRTISNRVCKFTGFDEVYCPNIRKEVTAILKDPARRQRFAQYLLSGR